MKASACQAFAEERHTLWVQMGGGGVSEAPADASRSTKHSSTMRVMKKIRRCRCFRSMRRVLPVTEINGVRGWNAVTGHQIQVTPANKMSSEMRQEERTFAKLMHESMRSVTTEGSGAWQPHVPGHPRWKLCQAHCTKERCNRTLRHRRTEPEMAGVHNDHAERAVKVNSQDSTGHQRSTRPGDQLDVGLVKYQPRLHCPWPSDDSDHEHATGRVKAAQGKTTLRTRAAAVEAGPHDHLACSPLSCGSTPR